jgi:hypothetical protein
MEDIIKLLEVDFNKELNLEGKKTRFKKDSLAADSNHWYGRR